MKNIPSFEEFLKEQEIISEYESLFERGYDEGGGFFGNLFGWFKNVFSSIKGVLKNKAKKSQLKAIGEQYHKILETAFTTFEKDLRKGKNFRSSFEDYLRNLEKNIEYVEKQAEAVIGEDDAVGQVWNLIKLKYDAEYEKLCLELSQELEVEDAPEDEKEMMKFSKSGKTYSDFEKKNKSGVKNFEKEFDFD